MTATVDYRALLEQRVRERASGWADARSTLRHFALINYAVPVERLEPYIPTDRFRIEEFPIGGKQWAMLSVVPFWDQDFRFSRLAPFARFHFGQTNHRVYIQDRQTGDHAAWFFGTTLGSWVVAIPRLLWRLPWHPAHYRVACRYNPARRAYGQFAYDIRSRWAAGTVRIADTGTPLCLQEGFESLDALRLILTHPVRGYFRRLDGALGSYAIWHREMDLTLGTPIQLYFNLYERLGIMTRAEMQRPHSIFLSPEVEFDIYLPPRRLSDAPPTSAGSAWKQAQ